MSATTYGYVIETCHEGTDWCIRDFDPRKDEEDERWPFLEEALEEGRTLVQQFNDATPSHVRKSRLYNFSNGGA